MPRSGEEIKQALLGQLREMHPSNPLTVGLEGAFVNALLERGYGELLERSSLYLVDGWLFLAPVSGRFQGLTVARDWAAPLVEAARRAGIPIDGVSLQQRDGSYPRDAGSGMAP